MGARQKGICAVMVSAVFFGLMAFMARIICKNGGNMMSVAFYRFLFAIPPLFCYLKAKGISFSVSRRRLSQIIKLSLFGYGGTAFLLYMSYNFIPSGMATTVHFGYPVFVLLGSVLFLGQRFCLPKLVAVLFCGMGITLFYNGEAGGDPVGLALAFASSVTYAFYILYLERSGLQELPTLKLIFYMNIVSAAVLFLGNMAAGTLTASMNWKAWIVMIILSLGASFISVAFFQRGEAVLGAQDAAILSTFEPITSVVAGILLLDESLNLSVACGCILILAAAVIAAKQGKSS